MIDEVVINRVFFVIIIILIALLYISLDENVRLSDIFSQISGEIRTAKLDFKTETVAVCDEADNGMYCHDEVFVTCGGVRHRIVDVNGSIMIIEKK